jgi:hypothetical protein
VCEERVDLYGLSAALPPTSNPSSANTHSPDPPHLGPFWTLTTLILTIYLSSSLSSSLAAYLSSPTTHQHADLTLLSLCTTLIYTYGLVFPAVFWAATKWLARNESIATGGASGGIAEWGVVEALAIWGYSMAPFVPVSVRLRPRMPRVGIAMADVIPSPRSCA